MGDYWGENAACADGNPAITRRRFVAAGCAAAALVASGPLVAFAGSSDGALYPPGGQDEGRLISHCLHCYRCISACPTSCLEASPLERGVLRFRIPVMDFSAGYCTFCDECRKVCPTGALLPFDASAQKVGLARLDSSQCVAYRSPGSCKLCVDACEYHAITLNSGGIPVVDDGRCNGCGACQNKCPSATYLAYSADSSGLRGINVVPVDEAGE